MGLLPNELYNVKLPIDDPSSCNFNLPFNPNSQLCVGDADKHACRGNSSKK